MTEVVVVGAGPAGLTAAWRLAVQGVPVRVLERDLAVGGMARSIEVAGQRVDLGSHRLHPGAPPHLIAALRDLLGDELQTRARQGRIRLGARWLAFPLRPFDVARRSPPGLLAGAARDAVRRRGTRSAQGVVQTTFADVVRARFGPTVLDRFYGPYARKLWGIEPDALDAEVALRRIAAPGAGALVRTVLGRPNPIRRRRPGGPALAAASSGRDPGAGRGTFLYPRRGFGQISERLADAVVAAGGTIELGARVEAVSTDSAGAGPGSAGPGSVRLTVDGRAAHPSRVLWTAPITGLAAVAPSPPAEVANAVAELTHRAVVLVYVVVAQPQLSRFDAHYLPEEWTPVSRLSEPKNYRAGDDPPDRTVLCAEIPCSVGDEIWNADDETLGAEVRRVLTTCGMPSAIAAVETRRLPRVYPVLRLGTPAALDRVGEWAAAALPGVVLLGRQGLFVADNLHHVMAMGWDAADLLADPAGWDATAWAGRLDEYLGHVVAD